MKMSTPVEYVEHCRSSFDRKQVVSLQLVTILCMTAEDLVAIIVAIRAQSIVLLGFGADSGIELAKQLFVFFRFKGILHVSEKLAARSPPYCYSPWPDSSWALRFRRSQDSVRS